MTPGDSLRLDLIGVLGAGRGSAFVVGDSQRWAQPEEEVRKFVPNYPLLWAMLGVPRPPARFDAVNHFEDPTVSAWRFTAGGDTVEVVRIAGPPVRLIAEVRERGARLGRVETVFTSDGALRRSRLDVPGAQARLQLEYYATARQTGFSPDTWLPPDRDR